MSDSEEEMMERLCRLRDSLKKCEDMCEKLKALREAMENLMMSLRQEVQFLEDQQNRKSHSATQVVDGSERVDAGAGSLMAAGVAGRDHDEPLGNGVTNLLASNAVQIPDNLDSSDPVQMIGKTSSSSAPTGNDVSPVEVDPLPHEDALLSDCDVGVISEMYETNCFPMQVSHPLLLDTYSTSALRLTAEAIARVTSHATDLSINPFQPILPVISRADVIVESVEINVFRLDRAEELLN